jgi:hypothetical protein
MEYNCAVELGKRCLVFLSQDRLHPQLGLDRQTDLNKSKQFGFRSRVSHQHTITYFHSEENLKWEVTRSVANELQLPRPAEMKPSLYEDGLSSQEVGSTILLFPYITTDGGFDTGIAITNPNVQPYFENAVSGSVRLRVYGNYANDGLPPGPGTTPHIAPGTVWAASLRDGPVFEGGKSLGEHFSGLVIAECSLPNAQGVAFVHTYGLSGSNSIASMYRARVLRRKRHRMSDPTLKPPF